MAQLLALLMEDREAARAEHTATLATLQHLATLGTNNNTGGNGNNGNRSRLRDFQNTDPHVFSKVDEALDADDWLHTIETKLKVATVADEDKVLYASHYLAGPAGSWWETIVAASPADHVFTWEEFTTKFRKRHIPNAVMMTMRDKFLKLRQGTMSVQEYFVKFTVLSRYAPNDTDSDDKRKERFLNGLHGELQYVLVVMPFQDLESLADTAS